MKRILAALALAAIALPAAAAEHGGPWSEDETRAPWDKKQNQTQGEKQRAPEADPGAR